MAALVPLGRFCGMEGRKCDTYRSKGPDSENVDRTDDSALGAKTGERCERVRNNDTRNLYRNRTRRSPAIPRVLLWLCTVGATLP